MILAVDGNNLLMRSIKATEGRVELSSQGISTAALVVFVNMLSRYVAKLHPERMVVCWDGGASLHRKTLFPEYKAKRTPRTDEGPESAFNLAKEFLSLAGIHHVEKEGYEADDLIAYYWYTRPMGEDFVVLSGDKDFFQLLDHTTRQIRPSSSKDEIDEWNQERLRREVGCKSEHVPLIMALTGDAGDGVIGIRGIGQKTAVKLLTQYEWDLDRLLELEPKVQGYDELVKLNLSLVDLRQPLSGISFPVPPRVQFTKPGSVLYIEFISFLNRYAMITVRHRLIDGTLWSNK